MTTRPDPGTPETPKKAPDGPRSGLNTPSGHRETPRGENGPQTSAESLASWSQLEARAFNAVQPALRDAGEWLPLSARRAVARAVLVELKRELDALAEYENTINWMTTCTSCARALAAYSEHLSQHLR